MFKTADFRISRPMYAVDPDSLSVGDQSQRGWHECVLAAAWFKRRRAHYNGPIQTVACAGFLRHGVQGTAPADAADFLARFTDGRYGGRCVARWDGSTLWCLEDEETRAQYKALLVPMLEAYPAIPPGYDGWWHFG